MKVKFDAGTAKRTAAQRAKVLRRCPRAAAREAVPTQIAFVRQLRAVARGELPLPLVLSNTGRNLGSLSIDVSRPSGI
jgi:hypothetical protein